MNSLSKSNLIVMVLIICLCFVLFPVTPAHADSTTTDSVYPEDKEHITYTFLEKDVMPIIGYVGMPSANAGDAGNQAQNPSFITRTNFQRYVDAGFNVLSGLYEREPFSTSEVHRALKLADEVGLAYFVNDTTFRCETFGGTVQTASEDDFRAAMQEAWYIDEPAFAGIAVKDEPSAQDFDGMASVNKVLQELTDGKMIYTNLFPSNVESERLYLDNPSESVWDNYVQYAYDFVKKIKPDVIAYDHYVFMNINSTLENIRGTSDPVDQVAGDLNLQSYIRTLSLYRTIGLEFNIPFWVSVTSFNHRHQTQLTEKQIAWLVNSSLAYGAKGIQYYTYWPTIDGSTMDSWANPSKAGLVTANGTPHDTYYQIKAINENIQAVDQVLMKSTNKGVIQYGKQVLPLVAEDTLYGYGLLSDIEGGDIFVGCFDCEGNDVYYIVNNSFNAGRTTFKANFLDKVDVTLTNSEGVIDVQDTFSVGFNLSGGQAILLEVKK